MFPYKCFSNLKWISEKLSKQNVNCVSINFWSGTTSAQLNRLHHSNLESLLCGTFLYIYPNAEKEVQKVSLLAPMGQLWVKATCQWHMYPLLYMVLSSWLEGLFWGDRGKKTEGIPSGNPRDTNVDTWKNVKRLHRAPCVQDHTRDPRAARWQHNPLQHHADFWSLANIWVRETSETAFC